MLEAAPAGKQQHAELVAMNKCSGCVSQACEPTCDEAPKKSKCIHPERPVAKVWFQEAAAQGCHHAWLRTAHTSQPAGHAKLAKTGPSLVLLNCVRGIVQACADCPRRK